MIDTTQIAFAWIATKNHMQGKTKKKTKTRNFVQLTTYFTKLLKATGLTTNEKNLLIYYALYFTKKIRSI